MQHIITAKHGDTIIINLPQLPDSVKGSGTDLTTLNLKTKVLPKRSANEIINTICAATNIDRETLISAERTARINTIRFYTAHRLRELGLSYVFIGKKLDRDHTTIIHAVRTFKNRIKYSDEGTVAIVKKVEDYEKSKNQTNA